MKIVKINSTLIDLCLANNRTAQRELYDILLPYLNAIGRRYCHQSEDVKDVLQNAFINIFKNIKQFDETKASFKTWSTKIMINACLKNNERHQRKGTQEFIVGLHDDIIEPAVWDAISHEEIMTWLKKMPLPYFEVFNLRVIDGFSHGEIAELLNIEETLSRKRLSRARAWLQKRLPNDDPSAFLHAVGSTSF